MRELEDLPDFGIVEQTFERRMQELNLSPRPIDKGIDTGYDGFALYRLTAEVAEAESDDPPTRHYLASLEVKAALDHPSFGSAEIKDRITLEAESLEKALELCANTYMDVTFPALQRLFEGTPAPGTLKLKLSSMTPSLGKMIRWETFSGKLQILNDPKELLAGRFREQLPFSLVLDTLCGFLAEPRLHWCKLYGGVKHKAGLDFGCSIDGQKSAAAEAEAYQKFTKIGNIPGQWEFRQFFVMRPAGEPDAQAIKQLHEVTHRLVRPSKIQKWWHRLIGK